jgi:hypothetical protein
MFQPSSKIRLERLYRIEQGHSVNIGDSDFINPQLLFATRCTLLPGKFDGIYWNFFFFLFQNYENMPQLALCFSFYGISRLFVGRFLNRYAQECVSQFNHARSARIVSALRINPNVPGGASNYKFWNQLCRTKLNWRISISTIWRKVYLALSILTDIMKKMKT